MKQTASTPLWHDLDPESNLTDLVLKRAKQTPDDAAYAIGTDWESVSYRDFLTQVRTKAKAILARGIGPGDTVAIMAPPSYEWAVLDQALWFAGVVSVPIYHTSSVSQAQHILTDSGAKLAFAGADQRPVLERTGVEVLGMDEQFEGTVSDDVLEKARTTATLASTATLVYTSGTTGKPKGTKITHGNLAVGALNILDYGANVVGENSRTLMFLPMTHILARAVHYFCLVGGIQVAHSSDLMADLKSFRPTWLLLVPRVLEKVEAGILAKGNRRIIRAARRTAIDYARADSPGLTLRARHKFFDVLVYKKIRELLGGEARYAICGGSALNPELAYFFTGMGLPILEGYGLTESTAPATFNIPGLTSIGTLGRPVPGMDVAIAEDDEILLRGIMVFAGYHGDEPFEGWYPTGDLGHLDDAGFLSVTGRKKDLLITASGKNVLPAPLEETVRAGEFVDQAVVVGDNRPFVGTLITLDAEGLANWCKANHRELSIEEACTDEQVRDEVQSLVDEANQSVSRAESIRKFHIIPADLSGYMTPSEKLRRRAVVEDFSSEIERLYSAQ